MKYWWRWIPVMWLCNVCVLVCARKRVSFSVFQNTNNNDMHTIVKLANQMFEIPRTVKSVFIPALFPFPEKSHLCEIFCEYCIKYNTKFLTKICQSIFWVCVCAWHIHWWVKYWFDNYRTKRGSAVKKVIINNLIEKR